MKKILLFFGVLIFSLSFNVSQSFASGYDSEIVEGSEITSVETDIVPFEVPIDGSGCTNTYNYPGTSVKIIPGDMLVTNSTISSGLTGHAGIVVDCQGYVASIKGPGHNPKLMSISSWFSEYPKEKVVRYSNSISAAKAANAANNYVRFYSNATYDFSKLYVLDTTYCSKIVWRAFYDGAGISFNGLGIYGTSIFKPYDIPALANTSVVYKNW